MDYSIQNIDPAPFYFFNTNAKRHGQDWYNAISQQFPMENLPDYNGWDCNKWIDFHKRLKARYGKENANLVWNEYFNNKPTGWTRDRVCTGQDPFVNYFKEQGIKFDDNFYSVLPSFGTMAKNLKTGLIVAAVVGGALLLTYIGYQIYMAYTIQKIAVGGLKKAADNPELVGKGVGAGLRGGI